MRFLAGALSLVASLALAGCMGGDETTTVTVTTGSDTGESTTRVALTLYFLRDGKVAPVEREVLTSPQVAGAALSQLLLGPTDEERAEGLETAIPPDTHPEAPRLSNGVLVLRLSRALTSAAEAQIVYTLTQFPTVKRVAFTAGPARGRRAFENQTPAILVESPLPGETVESNFEATGTANTFEATFNYELQDASGKVISKDFVTATSGSGTRGTFSFRVPYEVSAPTNGALVVFELSAADGSRINEHEIPLRLE